MAIGKAIPYTEDELESEAQISSSDIEIAVAMWRKYAPSRWKDIIQDSKRYTWDPKERKYLTKSGKYLDTLVLRNQAIEPFLTNVKIAMRGVSQSLQSQDISLQEWQTQMIYLIKYSQIAAALVANGGVNNTTQNDLLFIVAMILFLLKAHTKYTQEIEEGKQATNGLLLSRSSLYAAAGRDAFEEMGRYGKQTYSGVTEERRVLDPQANHCVPDGAWESCPQLAEKGWQPIGTLPRLMDTPCRTNCKCHWEFR